MEVLTVEKLQDIVESQLCIYGNRALFLKVELESYTTFQLFAGDSTQYPVLECVSHDEQCLDDGGLEALSERLIQLDGAAIIYCSDDNQFNNQFSVGFKSSIDGFVETINSSELIQPTIVQ